MSWTGREGALRRLCPEVPVVKTPDTGQADDAGGRGGPGLDWTTIGGVRKAGVDQLGVVGCKGGGGPHPAPRGWISPPQIRTPLAHRSRVRVPDGPPGIPGTYAGSFRYARACGVSGRPHMGPGITPCRGNECPPAHPPQASVRGPRMLPWVHSARRADCSPIRFAANQRTSLGPGHSGRGLWE
jgi:hypothetical protein